MIENDDTEPRFDEEDLEAISTTLDNAGMPMSVKQLEGELGSLRKQKSPVANGFAEFAKTWEALPPLIRAAVASSTVDEIDRHLDALHHSAVKREMPRRASVAKLFAVAKEAQRKLFISLTNIADKEAFDMGIESDVRYLGDFDEGIDAHVSRKHHRSIAMWRPEKIASEIDQQALAAKSPSIPPPREFKLAVCPDCERLMPRDRVTCERCTRMEG